MPFCSMRNHEVSHQCVIEYVSLDVSARQTSTGRLYSHRAVPLHAHVCGPLNGTNI